MDPLVGLNDARKPLRTKLLAVPRLRERYLQYVRTIAEEDLNWQTLGPVVEQYRSLIEKEVETDTRKLSTTEAFKQATANTPQPEPEQPGRRPVMSLRSFADQRRTYLLHHPEIKRLVGLPSEAPKRGGAE